MRTQLSILNLLTLLSLVFLKLTLFSVVLSTSEQSTTNAFISVIRRGRITNKKRVRFWLVYSLYYPCNPYSIQCSLVPFILQFNRKLYKSYIVVLFTPPIYISRQPLFSSFQSFFVQLRSKPPHIQNYYLLYIFSGTGGTVFFIFLYHL